MRWLLGDMIRRISRARVAQEQTHPGTQDLKVAGTGTADIILHALAPRFFAGLPDPYRRKSKAFT